VQQSHPGNSIRFALAIGLFAAVGCGGQQQALELSNAVAAHWRQVSFKEKDLLSAMNRGFETGEEKDLKRARNALVDLTGTTKKVIANIEGMSTAGVEGGSSFKTSSLLYFKALTNIQEECYLPAVDLLEKNDIDKTQKKEQIQNLLGRASAKGNENLRDLKSSQQSFAAKHNITLNYQ
jgi:hypothetical protein